MPSDGDAGGDEPSEPELTCGRIPIPVPSSTAAAGGGGGSTSFDGVRSAFSVSRSAARFRASSAAGAFNFANSDAAQGYHNHT